MENYLLYVFASIILILTPGADTVLVTKNTISLGSQEGRTTALGTASGIFVHTCAVVLGITTILSISSVIYEGLKIVGAIYLFYLGFKSLRDGIKPPKKKPLKLKANDKIYSPYWQGVLTNVLNPKIAVFFLTFLPQFVNPSHNTVEQFFLLGITYIVFLLLWLFTYIYLLNYIKHWFEKTITQRIFDGISGSVMMGLGLKLALEK